VVQAVAGFEFHILDADPRRIKRVRVVRKRALARRRHTKGEGDPAFEHEAAAQAAPVSDTVGAGEQKH